MSNLGQHIKNATVGHKQRLTALFLCQTIVLNICLPFGIVYADSQSASKVFKTDVNSQVQQHLAEAPDVKTKMSTNYAPGQAFAPSTIVAAADTKIPNSPLQNILKPSNNGSGTLAEKAAALSENKGRVVADSQEVLNASKNITDPVRTTHELVDKRTAKTSLFQNSNGTLTQRNYISPHFYKKDNAWATINTSLSEDNNADDATNIIGKALGHVETWVKSPNNYLATGNDWTTRFSPSNSTKGMVRLKLGGEQIGYVPLNANHVDPKIIIDKDGHQSVYYYDLWKGVDVQYIVESDSVKENIVLRSKDSANSVSFKIIGAGVAKQSDNTAARYTLTGVADNKFSIAPSNLILNSFGLVTEDNTLSESVADNVMTLAVNQSYLQKLPEKAFPAVIDPSTFYSNFGTRDGGNYVSFKSDGYVCNSNVCNPYAGSLYDSGSNLRYWRSAFFANYDQLRTSGNVLTNASLHLYQRNNAGFWTGNYNTHTFYAGHATCTNNFNCLENNSFNDAASFATSGDINVTDIYQTMVSRGDFGAWLMLGGEDGTTDSYKNFDPGTGDTSGSYIAFTYGGAPGAPAVSSPTNNQVYVDTQPTFTVSYETNPNGSADLQYQLLVSSGTGGYGTIVQSSFSSNLNWTVPSGILQDGMTYYVQARAFDPITNTYSPFGSSISFKINMRTSSKDSTQSYDSVGPVNVDLATGNLTTSNSSHSSSALGGSLGISLDYKSPLKSRQGLVGDYYNYMDSTSTPALTRVDPNIDFSWGISSPGSPVYANKILIEWNGYFVAPVSGSYQFGVNGAEIQDIWINKTAMVSGTNCSTTCYDKSVTLTAGQAVPILMESMQTAGTANVAHMYVKGAVSERVVPKDWLQTGVRPVSDQQGLVGNYFGKFNGANTFSAGNPLLMQRTDHYLNFDWGTSTPMQNGPSGYLVRWTGYITVPVSGNVDFGTFADDGTKIMVGNASTVVLNNWVNQSATQQWASTPYNVTANTPTKIVIEYYNDSGTGSFQLKVRSSGSSTTIPAQTVPSNWLSTNASILPLGWSMELNADGGISYDHATVNQSSVTLSDASGGTHEYTWNATKSAYVPPVNEDGQLLRNAEGTYTLEDTDGKVYVFNIDGTLRSVFSANDSTTAPTNLQYEYAPAYTDGPANLTKIKDGADPNRYAAVYYSGDTTHCAAAPSGYDAAAPASMICSVITNDGRQTNFFYISGQLARINRPGNDNTDYIYQSLSRNNLITGYLLTGIRSPLANDAMAASIRANDATGTTQVAYDYIGRVSSVTNPAANASDAMIQNTFSYLPGVKSSVDTSGNIVPGYLGMTDEHIANTTEPAGFSREIKFDNLYRTITDTDINGLSASIQWDTDKDIIYSASDPTGLKTTTVYDDEDRPTDSYGPAPAAWFTTTDPRNQIPTSTYTSQVAHTQASYDQNIVGPYTAWYDYSKQTGNTSGSLFGTPKLHTTGIGSTPGALNSPFTSPPVSAGTGMQGIGFSATGKVRLAAGSYTFSAATPDGVRLWVDDQLVIDSWTDSTATRTTNSSSFTISNASPKRFRLDVYRRTGTTGSFGLTIQQSGGFAATTDWSSYLKPDYSLPTSATKFDGTLGNVTATTSYGTTPELALPQSSTTDASGLNLSTTATFEAQGALGSLMRQTTKNLPGNPLANPSFSYSYYTATETKDNPCTTGVTEAYRQGGLLKLKTEASPNGGATAGRKIENIYDDAGRIVASRQNTDSWTCTTYDSRGRITQIAVPAFNGNAAITTNFSYAVSGNPLKTTKSDGNGYITTTVDLLGRTKQYSDIYGNITDYTYLTNGQLYDKTSPMGHEVYVYDTYHRLTGYQFGGLTYATVYYDGFSRVDHISYNQAGSMKLTVGRDSQQRDNSLTYLMGDGTTSVSDTVTLSQSGRIGTDVIQTGSNNLYQTYGYDNAGRLTSAAIGPHTYSYGYGTQNTACGTASNMNANAGKNGDRTSQNVDGVSTYYCYDYADRLVSSNDATANYTEYDTHGNMTYIGTGATPLRMCYDSEDRNTCLVNYNSSGNGSAMYYGRDTDSRITYREHDNIASLNWTIDNQGWYGYTGSGDSPDFIKNSAGTITEQTLQLPGGVMLTGKPQETIANNKQLYTLPSALGRTLLTTNAVGTNTSTGNGPLSGFTYDPFGGILAGSTNPANTTNGSYGYGGPHEKITETSMALAPVQMGSRVYLASIGRFTSNDPIEGGNANNYAYVLDPINGSDYSGQFGLSSITNFVKQHVKAIVIAVVIIVVVAAVVVFVPEAIPAIVAAVARIAAPVVGAATAVGQKAGGATTPVAKAASSITSTVTTKMSGGVAAVTRSNPLEGTTYTTKVENQIADGTDIYHSFPKIIDGFGGFAKQTALTGGDKITRLQLQLKGSINGRDGIFEYIIEPDLTINHREFIEF